MKLLDSNPFLTVTVDELERNIADATRRLAKHKTDPTKPTELERSIENHEDTKKS
jgi:hypothetical protein